jgi:carboxymethylenebutenolidase
VPRYSQIVATSIYSSVDSKIASTSIPVTHHLAGKLSGVATRTKELTQYDYPGQSTGFATPFSKEFHYSSESVSHTRNLSFFKPLMGGPYFDLEAIWDEHTYYEFENRSVELTMLTMVQEPYVNHVPTVSQQYPSHLQ